MTFLEQESAIPSTGEIIGLSVLAVLSLLCCYRAARVGHTKTHYHKLRFVRFLFPFACFATSLRCVILACTELFLNMEKDIDENIFLKVVFIIEATIVPIMLVVTFELCYLVHKRRSVNFCGMIFDRGQRVRLFPSSWIRSFLMRNLTRMMSVIMLAIDVVTNLDLMSYDPLIGRAGWAQFLQDPRPFEEKLYWFLSLMPTAVLVLCDFYFSIILWRYGTSYSMVVHSSLFNPWFSLFFGTLALGLGQCFPLGWFTISSNVGFIIYFLSIILLMKEVDKDMAVADDFDQFLQQVEIVGNKTSVTNVIHNPNVQNSPITTVNVGASDDHTKNCVVDSESSCSSGDG